ncbi:MAG TPA: translocation protein TolB, partial [Actinophytocola sp.]|nr:translocation protein TolB [Actinophytocola sp.]HEU5474138.1 translocation protein TolB [Actinophytocola sp.]
QSSSEITGPAFTPAGNRLYFSSQRGTSGSSSGGITYEVTGPFRT